MLLCQCLELSYEIGVKVGDDVDMSLAKQQDQLGSALQEAGRRRRAHLDAAAVRTGSSSNAQQAGLVGNVDRHAEVGLFAVDTLE